MTKLNELLKSIDIIESWNEKDIDISGISYHSKKVEKDHIFVCIKGYKTDGHKYIMSAINNGAVALIVEDFQEGWKIPQYKVNNSRIALAHLSSCYYNNPSNHMKMIGITATNGKTTTSFMVDKILADNKYSTGLIGTVVSKFSNVSIPSILTTPESLNLQNYFYQMKNKNISHVTMEVSSSSLELSRVADVDFDIVAFNNISREHIDLHGSFEDYFRVKSSLIRNAKESAWAVINIDSLILKELISETKANILTFGVENNDGDLSCEDLDLSTGRAVFYVSINKPLNLGNTKYKQRRFKINLSVPGYHSVYNSMSAIAIALLAGVPINNIQKSLENFIGVERRFQFIFEDNFKIIDDHFANIGNINVTLATLNKMVYKDLHLIYAIRGSRGKIVNKENALAIVEWSHKLGFKKIIATTSDSHVTDKDKVIQEELDIFMNIMDENNIEVDLYNELPDAINEGISRAKDSDVVLLAGCQGMDYGAHIALKIMHLLRPDIDEDLLYAPLKDRVAGSSQLGSIE